MAARDLQPLDSPVYAAQPREQPVKPVAARCDELGGHFYDRDGECCYCAGGDAA